MRMFEVPLLAALASAFLASAACSAKRTDMGVFSSEAAALSEPVHERRTILNYGDGQLEDLGMKRYAESAEEFMQLFPMSSIMLSDSGHVIGFAPVLGPADGVAAPAEGTALAYIVVDTRGRLVDWEEADALADSCKLVKVVDPNNGSSYYASQNLACVQPSECVIAFRYNPDGTLSEITCPCTVVP